MKTMFVPAWILLCFATAFHAAEPAPGAPDEERPAEAVAEQAANADRGEDPHPAQVMLDAPVTLRAADVPLEKVFQQLGERGYNFVIPADLFDAPTRITLTVKEVPAREVLQAIAHAADLEVLVTEHGIVSLRPRQNRREAAPPPWMMRGRGPRRGERGERDDRPPGEEGERPPPPPREERERADVF